MTEMLSAAGYRRKAEECDQRAATAETKGLAATYRELAQADFLQPVSRHARPVWRLGAPRQHKQTCSTRCMRPLIIGRPNGGTKMSAEHTPFSSRIDQPFKPLKIVTSRGADVYGQRMAYALDYIAAQLWYIRQAIEDRPGATQSEK
jgi:hypothetical protein